MIFVGLTGVLGSGKSTVARLLQERGCDIIDIDGLARDSLNWKETQDDIREAFGIEYVVDGKVDVVKMRELAFGQADQLKKLEAIIHPRVRAEVEKRLRALEEKGARVVIFDHPLLFESGFHEKVEKTVVVFADMETIRQRLKLRGMEADDVERRLSFQISLGEKAARADYVINNNGTEEALTREVHLFLERLRSWEEERDASN
ncbi:MAG: coaE [Deltaproteobacteria bacterium]|jgi:dephospho-CoA kinase|nr:coaE [Deltaproteobacteria bacterium]